MTDRFTWHRRANLALAHGYASRAKRLGSFLLNSYPSHLVKGHGCYVVDTAGKRYLDFMSGQGTNLLGYANDRVSAAVAKEVGDGFSFSLSSTLEVETAEKIKELFPYIDCVRFLKNDDAALSAVTAIAKSRTGRLPAMVEPGEMTNEELTEARTVANRNGEFLVFDERDSGFRFPRYSAGCYYGVVPDLVLLGGAIANGLPLTVIGGKYDAMAFDDVKNDSLYAGETLALAAAKATMLQLQTKLDLSWLWKQAEAFQDAFNAIWSDVRLVGYPTRLTLMARPEIRAMFMQEACKAGMLFGRETYMNFPLAHEWRDAMEPIRCIVMKIQCNQVTLESDLPKEGFL